MPMPVQGRSVPGPCLVPPISVPGQSHGLWFPAMHRAWPFFCMKRLSALALLSLAVLSGCNPSANPPQAGAPLPQAAAKEPTIYFRNGFEIKVGGEAVAVRGLEECPFGLAVPAGAVSSVDQGKCIKLADETQTITVVLDLPEGETQEEWKVSRDAPSTSREAAFRHVSLYRPDGERITITENAEKLLDKCYVYQAAHVCYQ